MLPVKSQDVWTKAKEEHILQALVMLGSLPTRQSDSADLDRAAYHIALDGVTRYGLSEAVKFILRGSLKHTFFPSPVELRQQCDKAMEWPEREAERIRRREAIERDREPPPRNPSEGEKARVQKLLAGFYASYDKGKQAEDEAERAEIRARYGMTDEALASIKDQPLPANWKQARP